METDRGLGRANCSVCCTQFVVECSVCCTGCVAECVTGCRVCCTGCVAGCSVCCTGCVAGCSACCTGCVAVYRAEHVAVCCSVLQCVAMCCSVLQCIAVCYNVLQCVAVCCSVLQCTVQSVWDSSAILSERDNDAERERCISSLFGERNLFVSGSFVLICVKHRQECTFECGLDPFMKDK